MNISVKYQRLLKDLSLYNGNVDGIIGPKTTEAIKKFQKYAGVEITGKLDDATIVKLEDQLITRQETVSNDTSVHNKYKTWPIETTEALTKFYGPVGENQVLIEPPYHMVLAWDTTKPVKKFSCHKFVATSLSKVLETISVIYTPQQIKEYGFDLFGGCLNVRKIRGGNRWSTHAWGIAIDIDPARNGLNTPWNKAFLSRPECIDFISAFKSEGWYSLGLEKNYDAMHFQACYR